jgi:hypothetical protein
MRLFVILLFICPLVSEAQNRTWKIGLSGGAVYNFRTPLNIRQDGQPLISLKARYKTDPFRAPFYYSIKLGSYKGQKGTEVKLTHHKLILKNLSPDVQRFSVTDGFNLLTINHVWLRQGFAWSLGAGIVITHPESTIRNRPFPENKGILNDGYYISGPTIEAALHKEYSFSKHWFVSGEARATAAYVRVPVVGGNARVPNATLHVLGGLGYVF